MMQERGNVTEAPGDAPQLHGWVRAEQTDVLANPTKVDTGLMSRPITDLTL